MRAPPPVSSGASGLVRSQDLVDEIVDRHRGLLQDGELTRWRNVVLQLSTLGDAALMDLADACSRCLGKFGAASMRKLGDCCGHVRELASDDAARMVLRAAPSAVNHAPSAALYGEYLDALVIVARQKPFALSSLLGRQAEILPVLSARKLGHWIGAGLSLSDWDREGTKAYFRLETEEARRVLSQMTHNVAFEDVAASVGAFLTALWRLHPAMVAVSADGTPNGARTAFFGPLVRVPEMYPGLNREAGARQFRGALAHVAAHMVFGQGPEPIGTLKPVQVALISLIEDARVESMAAQELPGLRQLWASLHTAAPSPAVTVDKLFARLARALADRDYADGNSWVENGRHLFFEQRSAWRERGFSRRLGGELGHDLGQMRIPFNAKTYVVQPSYRDDNSGLWERQPDEHAGEASEAEAIDGGGTPEAPSAPRPDAISAAVSEADGVPAGRYSEWDYQSGEHRRSWTTVNLYEPKPAPDAAARALVAGAGRTVGRIEGLIRSVRIGRPRTRKAQLQGDALDLDACVRITLERRGGVAPDGRCYQVRAVEDRSLAIFVLLDMSHSTRDRVGNTSETIIGVERKAVAVLATAMERVGDPFAIAGFCSDGRKDVRIYEVKDFSQAFDLDCRRRLGGLRGMLSTRLGAALRHCAARLAHQRSERRLVLVLTDGEPSDVDVADGQYLIEDARKAVHELNHRGIDAFAVGLGCQSGASLPRIFSHRGFMAIDRIEQLPLRLAKLYHRLAG